MTPINEKYRQAIEEAERISKSILDESDTTGISEDDSIIKEYAEHASKLNEVNLNTAWIKLKFRYYSRYIYAAASVAAVLIITSLLIFIPKNNNDRYDTLALQKEIKPATGVVSLRLASGKLVSIDSLSSDSASLLGVDIDNNKQEISYTKESGSSKKTSIDFIKPSKKELVEYNELIIPKGRSYSLVLSDGTRVWLNAESSIHYPVSFSKGERRVKISGEAFFDVVLDANRVFIAETENYNIKVLGTKFNISSYQDEDIAATTLVSGSISIFTDNNSNKVEPAVVSPGEQFRYNKSDETIEITKVDTELYTSWVNNNLRLNQMPLKDIFKILSRRYDIDVVFCDERAKHEKFSGLIPLNDNLNTILDQLSKVSKVEFKVENRIIEIGYKD
jgi:hypothetical protein